MNNKNTFQKFALTFLFASALTSLFAILGAPFVRALRNVFGRRVFWLSGILLVVFAYFTELYSVAILCGSVWVLIGIYAEFEEKGLAHFWSAFVSILLSTAASLAAVGIRAKMVGMNFFEFIETELKVLITAAGQAAGQIQPSIQNEISSSKLALQLPSMVFVILTFCLGFALMLDKRVSRMLGLRFEKLATSLRTLEFRVPDLFVWIGMFSFLFSFIYLKNETLSVVGVNVFYSMAGLYFFHGLAVLEVMLLIFRAGFFTRLIAYIILVGQLFFVLSIVGYLDYWIDFRSRFKKIKRPENSHKNGEKNI